MSSLPLPLPPPTVMYPQPASMGSTASSKGSFGPVFIVLAVIALLAAVACVVGRLCARRLWQPKARSGRTHARGDIEDGFEINIPTAKPAGKQGTKGTTTKPAGKTEFKEEATNYQDNSSTKGHTNPKTHDGSRAKFVTMEFK